LNGAYLLAYAIPSNSYNRNSYVISTNLPGTKSVAHHTPPINLDHTHQLIWTTNINYVMNNTIFVVNCAYTKYCASCLPFYSYLSLPKESIFLSFVTSSSDSVSKLQKLLKS